MTQDVLDSGRERRRLPRSAVLIALLLSGSLFAGDRALGAHEHAA